MLGSLEDQKKHSNQDRQNILQRSLKPIRSVKLCAQMFCSHLPDSLDQQVGRTDWTSGQVLYRVNASRSGHLAIHAVSLSRPCPYLQPCCEYCKAAVSFWSPTASSLLFLKKLASMGAGAELCIAHSVGRHLHVSNHGLPMPCIWVDLNIAHFLADSSLMNHLSAFAYAQRGIQRGSVHPSWRRR